MAATVSWATGISGARLRLILSRRRRRFHRWLSSHRRYRGLPKGLDFQTVDNLCVDQLGQPLRSVSYTHLSGWKASGAYRLFLKCRAGLSWSVVYKNAIYTPEEIPALKGLPVRPGPPEHLVYQHARGALGKFLPIVYHSREIIPGRHYRYLLEDLAEAYRNVKLPRRDEKTTRSNLEVAVGALPKLHHALSEWADEVDTERLLRFDRKFSIALLRYAKSNLDDYSREIEDDVVSDLIKLWPRISALYGMEEFHNSQDACVIHGDYHNGHMYIHKTDPKRLKLIDWEWVGLGKPHADLASLLKRQDPETEQLALSYFSTQQKGISFDDHRCLYEWCQMERGLLDAAYLARQQMDASREVNWIQKFVGRSAARAIRAQEQLAWLEKASLKT